MSQDRNVPEIEASCLSCLFTVASSVTHIGDILTPEDFEVKKHGVLFGLIMDIAKSVPAGEIIDYLLVLNTATNKGIVKGCGGAEYILTISDNFAPSKNPTSYAQLVYEFSTRRQIAQCVQQLGETSEGDELDREKIGAELRRLNDILDRSSSGSVSSSTSAISKSYMDRVDRVYKSGRPVKTTRFGFSEIDSMLGGLEPGDVAIVAARPSQGKTSLAFNITLNITGVDPDARVLIFSLEMSREQSFDRMIATLCNIQTNLTRHRSPTSQEMKMIESASGFLAKKHIIIEDKKSVTVGQVRSLINAEMRRHGRLDLVVIDYLQLLSPTVKRNNYSQEMGDIAKALKVTAGDLHIPILALAQLNRDSEKRNDRPRLSDIKESGDIEAAADQVVLLYNPGFYEPERPAIEDIDVIVAKNRHGSTGIRTLQFDRHRSTFISSKPADPPGSLPDPDDDPFA